MTDHFYLISNASTGIYPNTLTKFTNHFGENPLTLSNQVQWQIGLESIFIHPRFTNIPMVHKSTPHIKIFPSNEYTDQTPYISIRLPYKHYTPHTLIDTINEHIKSKNALGANFSGFIVTNKNRLSLQMDLSNMTNEEKIKHMRVKFAPILNNPVLVHGDLATLLGIDRVGRERERDKKDYVRFLPEKIHFDIKLKELRPKVIKVEIDNVQPVIQNDSHAYILSYHTLNMLNTHLHHVEFDNPLYLTLTTSVINEFTVRLLDENNRQLELSPSLPTILKMNIRPLNEGTGEFNIVIDSTKRNPNYPNNTGTDFCFNLAPILQLDDDYICCINSISYSTFFKTLPIPEKEQYIKIIRETAEGGIFNITLPFNPKKKPCFNIQDVLNILNEDCLIPDNFPHAKHIQHPMLESRCAKFVLEEVGGISFVNIGGFPDITYDLPHELISILGEKNDEDMSVDTNRWVFKLDTPTEIDGLYKKKFVHPPDIISLIPITLFIYADFIQPIMVGDTQVNLLQIIPVRSEAIDGSKNKYVTEAIKRPNWTQVRLRTLDKLSFKIMRSDGKPINFHNDRDGVIITLTFKRKVRTANHNVMFL